MLWLWGDIIGATTARDMQRLIHQHWFGKPKSLYLQHLIIGYPINGWMVDHINGEPLDNRVANLQIVTNQHNQQKQRSQLRITSSDYKGVSRHKETGKWEARIRVDGKLKYLGLYELEIQAAQAYDFAAQKFFGRFANINL